MKKAIMAKKIGMTQVFSENGVLIPVTVLEAGPCVVVQKKTIPTTRSWPWNTPAGSSG